MNQKAVTVKSARSIMGGVSQAFIYKIINSGELRTFKMGSRRMIATQALDEYIEQQEKKETNQIVGFAQ